MSRDEIIKEIEKFLGSLTDIINGDIVDSTRHIRNLFR
jgi:hypothetical protein